MSKEWEEIQAQARAEFAEKYRRVHNVIDEHPGLSGLMTDEILSYLLSMFHTVGALTWVPEDLEPSWDLEIEEVVDRDTRS